MNSYRMVYRGNQVLKVFKLPLAISITCPLKHCFDIPALAITNPSVDHNECSSTMLIFKATLDPRGKYRSIIKNF